MEAMALAELFDEFPRLEGGLVVIRKMTEEDVDALAEITCNDNVYRYIPPFLYKKSRGFLLNAIKNLGGRDFDKKKMIIAGVYLKDAPQKLVGLAEIFDYKKRAGQATIGYRINESYWRRGIATEIVLLLARYLTEEIGILSIKAFVMPQNAYSSRALLSNGFKNEDAASEGENWGGMEKVELEVYGYSKR